MLFRSRFLLIAIRFAAVMTVVFALSLGLELILPPRRVNWAKALNQALSSSAVFLITDFFRNRVRGWLKRAPKWLLTPVRLPTKAAPRPKQRKETRWTPDSDA